MTIIERRRFRDVGRLDCRIENFIRANADCDY
jgi:hypothetical protein